MPGDKLIEGDAVTIQGSHGDTVLYPVAQISISRCKASTDTEMNKAQILLDEEMEHQCVSRMQYTSCCLYKYC